MNILSINCCTIDKILHVFAIVNYENEIHYFSFKTPTIFSFKKNVGDLLTWHKENIISILSQFKIDTIAIKKTERSSFVSKPKNSDILKLYLEGIMLAFAGEQGIHNKHYYKQDILLALGDEIFDLEIKEILAKFSKKGEFTNIKSKEKDIVTETLLTFITLEKDLLK